MKSKFLLFLPLIFLISKSFCVLNETVENSIEKVETLSINSEISSEKTKEEFISLIKNFNDFLHKIISDTLNCIDYWTMHLYTPSFQDKIENQILHLNGKAKEKIKTLTFLNKRAASFLGKIQELNLLQGTIIDDNIFREAVFCVDSFFSKNITPDDSEYECSFKSFEKSFYEKELDILSKNIINIKTKDGFYKGLMSDLDMPGYLKRNWLKISGVLAGATWVYANRDIFLNFFGKLKEKLSNLGILNYANNLNEHVEETFKQLKEQGLFTGKKEATIKDILNEERTLFIKTHPDIDPSAYSRAMLPNGFKWLAGITRLKDKVIKKATLGYLDKAEEYRDKIDPVVQLNYLKIYVILRDLLSGGTESINIIAQELKTPAIISSVSISLLFCVYIARKLLGNKGQDEELKELGFIMLNVLKTLNRYNLRSKDSYFSDFKYEDKGLLSYWIGELRSKALGLVGDNKVKALELADYLSDGTISTGQKFDIIRIEYSDKLFGV